MEKSLKQAAIWDEVKDKLKKSLLEYGYNAKEIEKGVERLKYSSKVRKDFSANVSHDLKSPLTSINGYAEMVSSGMVRAEDIQEFAKRINQEGNRL